MLKVLRDEGQMCWGVREDTAESRGGNRQKEAW